MDVCADHVDLEVVRPPPQRLPHPAQAFRPKLRREDRLLRFHLDVDQVDQVEQVAVEPDELCSVVVLVNRVLRLGWGVDVVMECRRRELEEVGGGRASRVDCLRPNSVSDPMSSSGMRDAHSTTAKCLRPSLPLSCEQSQSLARMRSWSAR